jgi:tRNA uridine 5-carboxymethylaminomethyl modification enzyme
MKYSGYLIKEQEMVEKMNRLESVKIDESFDFRQIHNLSSEAKEKLSKQKPGTLGQAARISGISPADVSVLMVHIGR